MNKHNTDPYAKKNEYQFITDNLNAKIYNLQIFCALLVVGLLLSIGCNYYAISKSHVIPYVVQVDDLGRAIATTEAKELPMNDDRIIKAFVYQYIDMARSVISDPETLTRNLGLVYKESVKSVQTNFLDPYYKDNNPFDYAQKTGTKHIEPIIFLKESENTYSVEWKEIQRNYDNQLLGETHYKALISVIQIPHTNEDKYRENPMNPFGLYVTSVSWSTLE